MASNREERFQMRQRGAGTHKVKDISFGLAFPGVSEPLQPQRSSRSRRTPQPEQQPLRPQRSTRRTPQTVEKPLPQQSSSAKTPVPGSTKRPSPNDISGSGINRSGLRNTRGSSQGSVPKKRKLEDSTTVQRTPTIADPPSSVDIRGVVGSESTTSQAGAQSISKSSTLSDRRTSLRSRSSLESAAIKEGNANFEPKYINQNQISPRRNTDGLNTRESKRKGAGATVAPKKKLRESTRTKRGSSTTKAASRPQQLKKTGSKMQEQVSAVDIEETQPGEGNEDESPQLRRPGRERPTSSLTTVEEEDEKEQQEDVEAPAKPVPRETTKSRPQKSQTTGPAKRAPTRKSSAPMRTRSTPARSHRARTSDVSDASTLAHRPSAKVTVPITVHRLCRPQALKNANGNEDSTTFAPKLVKRSGVNAIDVLSQICKELISQSAETLQRGSEATSYEMRRGEAIRKRKAVEAFGAELEERLFEMTEALDNNHALSMRARQATREKVSLREEFLKIRDERQKVALRMDEVRRVHISEANAAQERNDLNTALFDIELAVERGREAAQAQQAAPTHEGEEEDDSSKARDLELLLRTVAANVSSMSDGGGLLNQVREFNIFLERVATVLESRA